MNIENDYCEDDNDPFIIRAGTIIYAKYHLMNILISDKPGQVQKLPNQQQIMVKVAIQGGVDNLRQVTIELSSDNELQFNFQFRCNDMEFRRIKEIQNFSIQFREYPDIIVKNFQRLLSKSPTQNLELNFVIFSETEGKLDIVRRSEFKDDLIMEFNFSRSPEDHIQASVQHRYDLMRLEYAAKVKKFQEYRNIIKSKNPSLMMQIDKNLKSNK